VFRDLDDFREKRSVSVAGVEGMYSLKRLSEMI
jgi:hypothetical protein